MASDQPSDDDVCQFLFGRGKKRRYQLWVQLYTTMVDKCPKSGTEAIKKAVKNRGRAEAWKIIKRVYRESDSGDLHQINAEIFRQSAADCNLPLRKDFILKRGIPCAEKAVNLDPNDIEKHYLLIYMLSMKAHTSEERLLVIQKCQEALDVDKSFDEDHQDPQGPRTKISILLEYMKDRHERIESVWKSFVRGPTIKMVGKDIADYYSNHLIDESAKQVVTGAWFSITCHRYWEFWQCCCCDQKCASSDTLLRHLVVEHLREPQQEQTSLEADGNPPATSTYVELFPPGRKEWILADVGSSTLTVLPSCLLQSKIDTSRPAFPSRDMSITTLSYRSALSNWTDLRNSRKRLGTQLIKFILDKFIKHRQKAQSTTDMMEILKSLREDIESQMRTNKVWIYRNEITKKEELKLRDNPLGSYDYRDLLFPHLKSYIAGLVEKKADANK